MIYERIKSRLLPERSFLYFSYPLPGKRRDTGFYFPMFQNIGIQEVQKARISQLEILGRIGNLFTYQGSHSRQFKLQFSFNLDHIYHYVNEVGLPKIQFSNKEDKSRWSLRSSKIILDESENKLNHYTTAANRLKNLDRQSNTHVRKFSNPGEKIEKDLWAEYVRPTINITDIVQRSGGDLLNLLSLTVNQNESPTNIKDDSVNLLILLINVIRTSTVGNSSNTSLGPPTIYLNHGTMYNNIPCICTNYSISFDEQSTYEIFSLTPKSIKVSMDLSENRTGDFDKFKKFQHVKGENMAGWECVVEQGTMDPYNSQFYDDDPDSYSNSYFNGVQVV